MDMKMPPIILWLGAAVISNAQVGVPSGDLFAQAVESSTPVLEKRTLPAGVFFVVERLSTISDSGVASAMPGTRVTLVKNGSPMTVTDGQHHFLAYAYQLSDDPQIGMRLKELSAAAKAKAAEDLEKANKMYAESQRPSDISAVTGSNSNQPLNSDGLTPAQRAEKEKAERLKKIQALRQRIKELRQEILDARPDRNYRGRIYHDQTHDTQRLIDHNRREIERIKEEIVSLGGSATMD